MKEVLFLLGKLSPFMTNLSNIWKTGLISVATTFSIKSSFYG